MADSSRVSIYAAMAANIAIAIAKFIGAAISGSSAMLSEGIHSVVDSVNEILLLYGLNQSQKGPDELHPLGHGQELYFWSLVVAVLIFSLGGGFSIYEGVQSFQHPELSQNPLISYTVLGAAAVFEGAALVVSVREFSHERTDDVSFWAAVRRSKDPSRFIVIFEDAAALLGLAVAFTGVYLSEWQQNAVYDGIASIVIGLILTLVAVVLVLETKGLLIGESALPETQDSLKAIIEADQAVSEIGPLITLHLGPKDIMLALNIEFDDTLSADEIEVAVSRIEGCIRKAHPEVKRIFIEAASMP
ncbi:cation diffusion facilitator family transporter [Oscillatoria sp. CS-180]|uniref:cation diffusion facilitator family transporter n=1 Tax=Oscillatoria sp. CS-180 TaxID=3021720 RepID=UPI00232C3768|nr:cation diffusion facilitator family transporter [Oscillatoria sp. CS-180]MDB9525180.1 cation diffusion facilitator family transporter [Oscillatoria sp. CS-180]